MKGINTNTEMYTEHKTSRFTKKETSCTHHSSTLEAMKTHNHYYTSKLWLSFMLKTFSECSSFNAERDGKSWKE